MQLKNTFTSGKMNKDTDVRLIPNTEFIHAENIRFFSKGKNGVGQVIKGNEIVSNLTNNQNYTCIKALPDIGSENIYYFLANGTDSKIVRYNLETKQSKIILQGSSLNFNPNKKILGANILYDNLYWVEQHNNAPRFVDTTKADFYTANGFTEDDISIIKEPPFEEPRIVLTTDVNASEDIKDKWICFAYRYRYNDNSYSAVSFYSDWAFENGSYYLDFNKKTNRGMQNTKNACFIYFNSGGKNVVEIDLLFRESNTNNVYIIQSLNKADEGYDHDTEYGFKFVNNKVYAPIATDDVNSYYDNVPLLAKSQELIGNTLIYSNYYDGHDQKDINGVDVDYEIEYTLNSKQLNFTDIDSNTTTQDFVINFNGAVFKVGDNVSFSIAMSESQARAEYEEFNKAYSIELRNSYATTQLFIDSDEFISFINILKADLDAHLIQMLGDFLPPLTLTTNVTSFQVTNNSNFVTIQKFTGQTTDGVITDTLIYNFSELGNGVEFNSLSSEKSLHSNRVYELCLIHYDKYNRIVGVGTGKDNTLFIENKYLTYKNSIEAKIKNNPPVGAVKYKFGIKESKKLYETLYVTKSHKDGLYRWLQLDLENKSKITEGDIIVPKNIYGVERSSYLELDILEVSIKNYNFLGNNEEGGLYAKINPTGLDLARTPTYPYPGGQLNSYHGGSGLVIPNPYLGITTRILVGSILQVSIHVDSKNNSGTNFPEGPEGLIKNFIAETDYANIGQMIEMQNLDFGAFGKPIRIADNSSSFTPSPNRVYFNSDRVIFTGDYNSRKNSLRTFLRITDNLDYMIFETKPKSNPDVLFYEVPGTYKIENGKYLNAQDQVFAVGEKLELNAYNCYAFGNGVESYIYNDGLREKNNYLNFNFRGWATLEDGYKRTHRATDLIYSDVYRKETKFNGLSKFYSHLPNFKTLFEEYGEIEDIKNRDTNLFVAQENKLGMVMYGKSVLYSQAGEETIQATNEVLSSYVGFQGIHGVGKSPESISEFNKVMYLADPKRGQILSVIGNEVKVISNDGIEDYTRDLFKNNNNLLGGFDPNNYEYLLFIGNDLNKVLSYQELVGAFNAFYTYAPDYILGVDKKLYTWKNGVMYEHETTDEYNTFYGTKHPSKIEFCSNTSVSEDKIFTCISIEDKEAWDIEVETRLAKTTVSKEEFVKKESFYFSNLNKNINDDLSNAYGISNIIAITGNRVQVAQIPIQMSVGDKIGTENNRYDLVNIIGNELELNNVTGLNVGDFIFGLKNGLLDGGDIIGEYAVVKMSKIPTEKGAELFSVNTEVLKSN